MRTPALAFALAFFLAACGYVEATSVQYVGMPRFPAVDPAQVQVLRAEPSQRHDRLGEVMLNISVDPAPPITDIEQRLRDEAGKMGANAVYVVRDVAPPGGERKLIGIAVRYKQ